ncbi:MAG TPA: hypothetical protein VFD39_01335 [Trueperaceae bacterium]|nr:hypothetical protein [Trueperaceae bacterium]
MSSTPSFSLAIRGSANATSTVVLTVPLIVLFFFGQRYFIEGISTSGTKG